jgi:hypothetical protein
MKNDLEMLAKKGEVTVIDHPKGKTMVAVKSPNGSVVTLTGGKKEQLVVELLAIIEAWPDIS